MRRYIALALCLGLGLALTACGGKGGVEGTWVVDVDSVIEEAVNAAAKSMGKAAADLPAEVRDQIKQQAGSAQGVLEFRSDHTATVTMGAGQEKAEGTWALDGEKLTLTAKTLNGKPAEGKDAEPVHLTFRDGRVGMQFMPDAPTVWFKRK